MSRTFHVLRSLSFIASLLWLGLLPSAAAAQVATDPMAGLEQAISTAETAAQRSDFATADAQYRRALFEGWLLITTLERVEGRQPEAEQALGNASTFAADDRPSLQSLASAHLQTGGTARAIEILTAVVAKDPRDGESRRLLAKALAAVGQGERALQLLDEASATAPDDPEQVYLLATEYLWLKKVDSAARLYAEVAKARPIPQTHVLIGRTYRDAGEYERARSELRAALALDPSVRRAHYYLGMVALADAASGAERLEKAIAEFREELKLAPEDPLANDQLGLALLEAERPAEALPALETAVRGEPRALYVHHLGRCQLALDRLAEAASTSRRALELAREQASGDAELQKIHYQLGLALRRLGAPDAAGHLAEARRLAGQAKGPSGQGDSSDPSDPVPAPGATARGDEASPLAELSPPLRTELRRRVKAGLARAYFNLGVLQAHTQGQARAAERFARAAAFFERAAEADPGFPRVQSSLGVAYFNARQFDKATGPLARAVEAGPEDAGLKRMLAISWLNTESWNKALPLLREDPERARDASLQFAYGLALVRTKQAVEAETVLTGLLAQQGDSAELAVLLGQAYAQQGKYRPAVESLERALRLKPDVPDAHAVLGEVYAKQGRWPEAAQHLEAAATLAPEDAEVRDQLGRAYQKLGRTELAQQQFEASRRLKARH